MAAAPWAMVRMAPLEMLVYSSPSRTGQTEASRELTQANAMIPAHFSLVRLLMRDRYLFTFFILLL